jgi:enterochelin esterase family protein
MRWLHQRYDDLPDHGHLIAGPSLGGLAAAYAALAYPQVFSHCLSHSGSFWWQDEWLTHQLDSMPHNNGKFWISVGNKETQTGITHAPSGMRQDIAQLDACERFAKSLSERGHTVHYHLFEGSHSTQPWKEELPMALQWLLGENELS